VVQRIRAWTALAVVVVVVGVVPLALRRDSYPLSDYPMFARPRGTAEWVATAVAVLPGAEVRRLSPDLIAGTDEVILAGAAVGRAIREGTADVLCEEIASRVAQNGPPGAEVVEVVLEQFDAVRWFQGERTPIDRSVQARCTVRA
jgi:hypothetical protein